MLFLEPAQKALDRRPGKVGEPVLLSSYVRLGPERLVHKVGLCQGRAVSQGPLFVQLN